MNGVVSEAVPIVAIGMATRNAEDPLAQQIRQRMPDLAGLPVVDQTLGEPVDQPVLSLCVKGGVKLDHGGGGKPDHPAAGRSF